MSQLQQLRQICEAYGAQLVAVSKTKSIEQIMPLYKEGQRIFGENRVQELIEKVPAMPSDIDWHLIGHLQTNKVKQVLPLVSTIHAVDSIKLLREIEEQAAKLNKSIKVLLQMHIAQEETKFGLSMLELTELLDVFQQGKFSFVQIIGVMGMATNTDNQDQVRKEFKHLKDVFTYIKNGYFIHQPSFKEISMGMSGDYQIALEEGSTMIRVGSLLFE